MISIMLFSVVLALAVVGYTLLMGFDRISNKLNKQNELLERIAITLEAQEKLKREATPSGGLGGGGRP